MASSPSSSGSQSGSRSTSSNVQGKFDITMKGYLTKEGGGVKTWKKRWFILDRASAMMYYFGAEVWDVKEAFLKQAKGSFSLAGAEVWRIPIRGKDFSFQVRTTDRTYSLQANGLHSMKEWIVAIQFAIDEQKLLREGSHFRELATAELPQHRLSPNIIPSAGLSISVPSSWQKSVIHSQMCIFSRQSRESSATWLNQISILTDNILLASTEDLETIVQSVLPTIANACEDFSEKQELRRISAGAYTFSDHIFDYQYSMSVSEYIDSDRIAIFCVRVWMTFFAIDRRLFILKCVFSESLQQIVAPLYELIRASIQVKSDPISVHRSPFPSEPAFMSVYNTQSLFRLDLPYRALAHRSFGKYDAGFYFDTLHTLLPDNVDDSFDEPLSVSSVQTTLNPLRSPINRSPAPEEEEEEEDYLSTGVTHRKDKDLASGMLVEFDPDRISGNPLAFDGFFVDANIFQVPDRGDEAFEDYFFHVEAFLTTRFEAACQRAEIESSSDSTVGSLPCKKYVCRLLDDEDSVVGIVELYYAVITNSQTNKKRAACVWYAFSPERAPLVYDMFRRIMDTVSLRCNEDPIFAIVNVSTVNEFSIGMIRYTNRSEGFSLIFPAHWEVYEDESLVFGLLIPGPKPGEIHGIVKVMRRGWTYGLPKFITRWMEDFSESFHIPTSDMVEISKRRIGKHDFSGFELELSSSSGATTAKNFLTLCCLGNASDLAWTFVLITPNSKLQHELHSALHALVLPMFDTFAF